MDGPRKPLAKAQKRSVRKTVRWKDSEVDEYSRAASAAGEEFSEYVRSCTRIGHSMRQSVPDFGRTVVGRV